VSGSSRAPLPLLFYRGDLDDVVRQYLLTEENEPSHADDSDRDHQRCAYERRHELDRRPKPVPDSVRYRCKPNLQARPIHK
jgi:hypothetical protein